MSGVYIKGIEMPKSCDYCDFFEPYRESIGYCGILNSQIPCDCPLVPVPDHGRLIDADAYESLLRSLGSRDYRREKGTICDAIKFLHEHYAPTIIPADKEE